jgi:hypothetical protein
MPSIHPQQSATSSASALVTDGRPDPFLWIFSQISSSQAWFAFIHAANAASVRKLLIFPGSGMTGAMNKVRYRTGVYLIRMAPLGIHRARDLAPFERIVEFPVNRE